MSQDHHESSDLELRIGEVAKVVAAGWRIVFVFVVTALAIAAFYIFITRDSVEVSITVTPVSFADYAPNRSLVSTGFVTVSKDEIYWEFVGRLLDPGRRAAALGAAASSLGIQLTAIELSELSSKIEIDPSGYELLPPRTAEDLANPTSDRLTQTVLSKVGNSRNDIVSLLSRTISVLQESIRADVQLEFESELHRRKRDLAQSIEDVESAIKIEVASYELVVGQRQRLLAEAASIARSVDISGKRFHERLQDTGEGTLLVLQENSGPLYLSGYLALERELALLDERDDARFYVPGIVTLERQLAELHDDKTVERAQQAFTLSSFVDESQAIIRWDGSHPEVRKTTSAILALAFAAFLGLLTGCTFVLLRGVL